MSIDNLNNRISSNYSREIVLFIADCGAGGMKVFVGWDDATLEAVLGLGPGGTFVSAFFKDAKTGVALADQPAIEQAYENPALLAERVKDDWGNPEKKFVGNTMSGEDVQVELLKNALATAAAKTGASLNKARGVFTVPAVFTDRQKKSLINAAVRAGIPPLEDGPDGGGMISEPGALAVEQTVRTNMEDSGGVTLLIDLGFQTLDVTAAKVEGDTLNAIATGGVNQLGGGFIRDALETQIYEIAAAKAGLRSIDRKALDADERFTLTQKAERLSISLSRLRKGIIAAPIGNGRMQSIDFSREQFDKLLIPFADKTVAGIQATLDAGKLKTTDLRSAALAGGPFNIPYLQERVTKFLGFKPYIAADSTFTIAHGAALYGLSILVRRGQLKTFVPEPAPKFRDVTPHAVGIMIRYPHETINRSRILFPKGIRVPAKKQLALHLKHPEQDGAVIQLVQCSADNQTEDQVVLLGEAIIPDMPREPISTPRIVYDADYNSAGVVEMKVTDRVSGKSVFVTSKDAEAKRTRVPSSEGT